MIAFIDEHRERRSAGLKWGIEPMCAVLAIAPSTYHAAKTRARSARAIRDGVLRPAGLLVRAQPLGEAGAAQVSEQPLRDGIRVARCTVERLMRHMGLRGCRRGRIWVRTTVGDEQLDRPADLVERRVRAAAQHRLGAADLTPVATPHGGVTLALPIGL